MIFARADVECGGTFSLPVDGQFDRTHHIENMGEIAALRSVSIDDDGLTFSIRRRNASMAKSGRCPGPQTEKKRSAMKRMSWSFE